MIPLLLSLSVAQGVELTLTGSCPGEVTLDVTEATVSGMVAVFAGTRGYGADPIPAGPCAGMETDLAGIRLVGGLRVDWDLDGSHRVPLTLSPSRCGVVFQALDLGTCGLSDSAGFVERPMDLDGVYDSYESDARMVHVWQSDSSADLATYDTFCEDRGLEWFTPLSADDAQRLIDTAYGYDAWHTWILTKTPIDGPASLFGGYSVVVDGAGGVADSDGFTALRKWSTSFCDPEAWGYTRCWDGDHSYDWLVCQEP